MPRLTSSKKYETYTPDARSAEKSRVRGHRKRPFAAVFVLVILGLIVFGGVKHRDIYDRWRLLGYDPPASIAQLADQTTMTPYAKHLFYLNRPQLVTSLENFRQECPDSRDVIVLGCYHPDQRGIFIYVVNEPDLQGVSQVTAAHEDLHAIYERLGKQQRDYVNGLLQDFYKNHLTDQHVKDEIQLYKKTEPNDVLDEMHSTFGTEVADLPSALNDYYKQYFTNRSAITSYNQHYLQAFLARQRIVASDDQQLSTMKSQIDSRQSQLSSQLALIQVLKKSLDGLLANNQNYEYNNEVSEYNTSVNSYNSGLASLKTYIQSYNDLIASRNRVADEINALGKAEDTRIPRKATEIQ